MKQQIILFLSFTCSIYGTLGQQQNNPLESDEAVKMLHEFYTKYMTETTANPYKIMELEKKYATDSLIRKIEDLRVDYRLSYDPFINAQDCSAEWLKTLTIIKNPYKENLYYVSYFTFYEESYNTVTLIVTKEEEGYKISGLPSLDKI